MQRKAFRTCTFQAGRSLRLTQRPSRAASSWPNGPCVRAIQKGHKRDGQSLCGLGPLVIANVYRNRWQIETFFKWIKGNLKVKSLWGYSENAVKIHLWVAISAYLLLAWIKVAHKSPLTITEVSKVIEVSILSKANIRELLDVPDPLTQNQNVKELLLNF